MRPTGADLYHKAVTRLGCIYRLGILVPKNDAAYAAGFDCAELVAWAIYQTIGQLYGCQGSDPATADAYTGYFARDCRKLGTAIPAEEAMKICGALLLRAPGERRGHIAISDGLDGTVEAHSTKLGVIKSTAAGRVWTTGILVPSIDYAPTGAGGE